MAASDVTRKMLDACLAAVEVGAPIETFRDVVAEAVGGADGGVPLVSVPLSPDENLILHRSEVLTVTQSVFPAGFRSGLHDHEMDAVIGVWSGYEDNFLFRPSGTQLVEDRVTRVDAGQVLVLDRHVVHDVHAPPDRFTGAIHVYLGDLFGVERHEWVDVSTAPIPFDLADFAARWSHAAKATGLQAT